MGYLISVIGPGKSGKARAPAAQRELQMQKATWQLWWRGWGYVFCSWVDLGLNPLTKSIVVFKQTVLP